MTNPTLTSLSEQTDALAKAIVQAHGAACYDNPLLGIVLRDLIPQIAAISARIVEVRDLVDADQ